MVSDDSMSVKLGHVPDHGMTRVRVVAMIKGRPNWAP